MDARKRTFTELGEAEMELLQHVWALGRATVADVHKRVLDYRDVAYTTVMTVLKKLADKGYLSIEKEGVAYVYSAAEPPEQVRGRVLSDVIDKVFEGSPEELMLSLVRQEQVPPSMRAELIQILESMGRADDDAPEGTDR